MNPDGTGWLNMTAVDGAFSSMVELAKIRYSGFSTTGDHNISFRCTDYRDNIGPELNYTVGVMKNFLFVTKGSTPNLNEEIWLYWLDTHNSTEGYSWEYDLVPDPDVEAGLINASYYSTIILADYKFASNVGPYLQDYISDGGRVILLGSALDSAPRDFGLTSQPGTQGSSDTVFISSNLHYVTMDYNNSENVTVFSPSGSSRAVKNFIGTKLGTADSTESETMLGEYGGFLLWGPKNPNELSDEGNYITGRILDYHLLQSTVMPE
jgi:hypothetical protein